MFKKAKLTFLRLLLCVILFSSCDNEKTPTAIQFEHLEDEIDYIVRKHYKVGAAVGVIDKNQSELRFFYGSKSMGENDPPTAHTVFQIGSITKTFTSILLADMVLKGSINLDENVGHYLPADKVTLPTKDGVEITFKHLATHSSGIPKKPHGSDFPYPPGYDPKNAYAAYTKEHIYDYLTNYCSLSNTPGSRYLYSNTAVGLLGHTLGLIEGSSYKALVKNRIFDALGMTRSSLFVNELYTDVARGYSANFEIMHNFDANDIFQGAGFIKSTLNDMLIYLKAHMALSNNDLKDAIELTQQPHFEVGRVTYDDRPGEVFNLTVGLGWHKHKSSDGRTYFWHGGKTNGYTAYIGFDKSTLTGVVILCNYEDVDIVIFGDHILKAIDKY